MKRHWDLAALYRSQTAAHASVVATNRAWNGLDTVEIQGRNLACVAHVVNQMFDKLGKEPLHEGIISRKEVELIMEAHSKCLGMPVDKVLHSIALTHDVVPNMAPCDQYVLRFEEIKGGPETWIDPVQGLRWKLAPCDAFLNPMPAPKI